MTRIIFVIDHEYQTTYTIDDPRTPRELVKLINTGELIVAQGEVRMENKRQWASAITHLNIVIVVLQALEIELAPRHYDVLYGIADGLSAGQIASRLGIGRRTVYEYTAELKERFGLESKEEVIVKAAELGLI